jgi:hypothetical protein
MVDEETYEFIKKIDKYAYNNDISYEQYKQIENILNQNNIIEDHKYSNISFFNSLNFNSSDKISISEKQLSQNDFYTLFKARLLMEEFISKIEIEKIAIKKVVYTDQNNQEVIINPSTNNYKNYIDSIIDIFIKDDQNNQVSLSSFFFSYNNIEKNETRIEIENNFKNKDNEDKTKKLSITINKSEDNLSEFNCMFNKLNHNLKLIRSEASEAVQSFIQRLEDEYFNFMLHERTDSNSFINLLIRGAIKKEDDSYYFSDFVKTQQDIDNIALATEKKEHKEIDSKRKYYVEEHKKLKKNIAMLECAKEEIINSYYENIKTTTENYKNNTIFLNHLYFVLYLIFKALNTMLN